MAKVLIIDDEPNVLNFVCQLVEGEGHTTAKAGNCAEAAKAAEDQSINVIVADIFLPDSRSELEWMDRVKEISGERPFIFITGFPSDDIIDKSKSLGATAILTKPFEIVFLKEILVKLSA